MRLRILNVAYPFAPVGPDAVGGAEQVLAHLDAALALAGHESFVLASEGSITAGTLVSYPIPKGTISKASRHAVYEQLRGLLKQLLHQHRFDVVHMHGLDFWEYLPPPGPPVLATLHLPIDFYPAHIFHPDRPDTFLQCVSPSQRRTCPASACMLPEIENGVPVERFQGRHARRRFALALGRICPEKGFHIALGAAKRARFPLLLAGQVFGYEAHERYFREHIQPLLDQSRRFIGPLGLQRKRRFLAAAQCLLIPSLASETSSLVAMETLASGTPVVAFASGALADIVEHGKTGFLVRNEHEMAETIHATRSIPPESCRRAARERFALERTTEKYLAVYKQLAGRMAFPTLPIPSSEARLAT